MSGFAGTCAPRQTQKAVKRIWSPGFLTPWLESTDGHQDPVNLNDLTHAKR